MVGVFGDEHMGDGAFGRQRALDQPGRRRRLGDAFLAPAAGVFRANGDDDPQLRRHNVQTLAAILADPHHLPAAAGAKRALRLDHLLDPGQMFRQMADIARRARLLRRADRRRVFPRSRGLDLRGRALQFLERQLALTLEPLHPLIERLRRAADLPGYRGNSRPTRGVFSLANQPAAPRAREPQKKTCSLSCS